MGPGSSEPRRDDPVASPWGAPPAFWPPTPDQRAALTDVYSRVDAALAGVADRCRACGRCCRFEAGGVVLFASVLEMAHLVSEAGPPLAEDVPSAGPADAAWRCPYQAGGQCVARGGRPLGCRTYFCDAQAREAGEGLYSRAFREIRQVAEKGGGRWWYGPARVCLAAWGRPGG